MNSMKLSITILLAIMIVALTGCRRSSAPKEATVATNSSTTTAEQLNHPAGGTTPVADVKYFRGSIGNALGLQMKLTREGDKLWGSYFYQKVGTKIDLRGTIDSNGYLTLEEFDPEGKQTGVFKGIWQTNNDDGLVAIAGNWTKPNGDKKTAFSLHQEAIEFSGGSAEVTSKSIKETNKKLKYEIDAEYPQVTGASDSRFDKFNQEAKNLVVREAAAFRKDMDEWAADQAELPDQGSSTIGSSLNIGYNIGLATDELISTKFDIGTYFKGAAHPNSNSRVLNYDLKAGKLLKLADLFKPGTKYLQAISAYAIKDLKKQSRSKGDSLNDEGIESGAGADPKNYQSWVITKKGLGINFDSYQVASYAAGPQYVLIPYSALKDIIKPDGPLAPFVK
ncbi:MAG TPA: DUF3298 domain-containing protein [Pyrinomonadaceae bacterium]|nr:DUF3298 domain-containing protein [Pyrinomonadaceae bacterium]